MQLVEIVQLGGKCRQRLDKLASFCMGVQLIGKRARGGVVLLVLAGEVAHGFLEAGAIEHLAIQDVAFKGLEELQRAAHTDAEGLDAALEALKVAAFEDADQGLFASLLELVALNTLFLVGFKAIRGKLQALDAVDELVVDASIGGFEVVADGLQPAFWPVDGLALDGSVGVGLFDKRARATDDDLFEQVEKGDAGFLLVVGTAGRLEVFEQVADTGGGEITAIPTCEEVDLVIEVEDGIVDGSGREQDEFFALAADLAAPAVGGQNALEILVALGIAIAEVVAFIHEQDIGVQYVTAIELVASQDFLGDNACGNASAEQFVVPHLLQGCGADDNGFVALVIGEIFEQFLADPGFAETDAISNHDTVVTRQDFAGLLHSVFLEFTQFHDRAGAGDLVFSGVQVVAEVLKDGFHVDLVGSVGFASELGGVKQVDQFVLEAAGSFPLSFVPPGQFIDRQHARHIGGGHSFKFVQFRQAFAFAAFQQALDLFRTDFFRGEVRAVRQVQFFIGQQAGAREVGGADDCGDGCKALETAATVEEVAFGVQEALRVYSHLHMVLAQEGTQVFDPAQGLFV